MPRDRADVSYLDVLDRAGLVAYYADPRHEVPVDDIPEIDYFLVQEDGRSLPLAEAARAGAPFDWVVASHVIEHVPDVIGWLADLAELVVDDGALVLAIPDLRYTFDVHRPPTTVGQMIAAHDRGDQRPTSRAVYDHFSSVVNYHHKELWRGVIPMYEARVHTLAEAHERVLEARNGGYVDCHVWLWTPDTFLHQVRELRLGGLSQWFVEDLVPALEPDIEFKVRLRRLPRGLPPTAPVAREVLPVTSRPEWVQHLADQQATARRVEHLEGRVARLKDARRRDAKRLRSARRRARRLEDRTSRQRAEIERLRATPWQRWRRRLRDLFGRA